MGEKNLPEQQSRHCDVMNQVSPFNTYALLHARMSGPQFICFFYHFSTMSIMRVKAISKVLSFLIHQLPLLMKYKNFIKIESESELVRYEIE